MKQTIWNEIDSLFSKLYRETYTHLLLLWVGLLSLGLAIVTLT